MQSKNKLIVNQTIRYAILIGVGLLMIYPLIWMISSSFKQNSEIIRGGLGLLSSNPTLDGYIEGWQTKTEYTFTKYFTNTFLYLIPKIIFTVISVMLTAFALVRFKFPFHKIVFSSVIVTMLLPQSVLMIPKYLMFREFSWLDSYLPLVIPSLFATEGFFVFMMIQFLRGVPIEMEESAFVDGCNSFQVLINILMPILKPAIISVALFQFMWSMNDFFGPLIYITSVDKYPVSLALKLSIDNTEAIKWNSILAMSSIVLLPSIFVFFFSQKYFIEGATAGSIKG